MPDVDRPHRLNETAILDRRRQVAALYLARQTQEAIARKLEVSQTTVCDDLATLREEWRQEQQADIAAIIVRELAELSEMEGAAAIQFASTHEPAWILARLKIKDRRARLLGLDAPEKREHSGPGGAPLCVVSEVVVELPAVIEPALPTEEKTPPAAIAPDNGFLELEVDLP